jgi:hypothetical protein
MNIKKFSEWILAKEQNMPNVQGFRPKSPVSAKDDNKKIDAEIKKVLATTVGQPASSRKRKLQDVAVKAANRPDLGPKSVERIAQIASEIQ